MPRKTKAKKRHADLHRFKTPVNISSPTVSKNIVEPKIIIKEKKIIEEKPNKEDETITVATKADLKKTIIITLAIFALEFTIFYANLNGISFR